ncbi:Transcriptional regulator [Clostridium kluyveri DSM 555]|uniref:Transcriptional regulator n=1 Tax=Clostridium kluyveri (strain ATCC 8527 / DSM 555 / NBRC 12016 / NCIMB 10680 / K1) TaxID=431943 RepID=A5N558_CLOK5|nr:Transcriptional regulator [Clostridium kluyveri DSM 555]
MNIHIIISNSSGQPIYQQIASQIKNMIISDKLKEGEPLPSMRLLAKELRISVITTKRAYEELEREGFIVSITGKGSFVASKNTEFIREEQLRNIENLMQQIVESANICGLSLNELIEIMTLIYKGD